MRGLSREAAERFMRNIQLFGSNSRVVLNVLKRHFCQSFASSRPVCGPQWRGSSVLPVYRPSIFGWGPETCLERAETEIEERAPSDGYEQSSRLLEGRV